MKNLFDWINIVGKYNKLHSNTPWLIRKFKWRRELHKSYVKLLEYVNNKEYIDVEYIREVADFLTHLQVYSSTMSGEYCNNDKLSFTSSDMYMLINEGYILLDASIFANEKINFELRNEIVGTMNRVKLKEIKISTYDDYDRLSINILNNSTGVLEATEKDRLDAKTCKALKIQDINEDFKRFLIEQLDEYYIKFKKLL